MNWPSLGLSLGTADLTDDLVRTLQARWQTSALADQPLAVTCRPGALPPHPEHPPQTVSVSNSQIEVWAHGEELWLGQHLHVQLAPNPRITVAPGPVSEAAWLLALAELHRLSGWLPLHAATVGRGEQAVSITGVSGAGKSTAALRLAGAGWTVLAEDQTWVHAVTLRVTGLDRFLRTYPDSLERFAPHLNAQVQGQDAYGKQLLPLTPPVTPSRLTALLFFGLPPRPGPAERVRGLWECTGLPLLTRTRASTARSVSLLLQQLEVQGTTRETVMTQVDERLKEARST